MLALCAWGGKCCFIDKPVLTVDACRGHVDDSGGRTNAEGLHQFGRDLLQARLSTESGYGMENDCFAIDQLKKLRGVVYFCIEPMRTH